ncbi:MAG: metal-dependent transcriptional regulator [Propionicimonas sp.]|nr:metal-dependent transcriptional regulator [Propionicimonas sp.]
MAAGVNDLTPLAQDYVKVIWAATEWGEPPITTKGLAARFQTSQANVSDAVRRLAAQGLVSYEPYRPVVLTERGRALATAMVRRHRLLECFLAEVLGYGWDEVHDEAERLEHAVSDDFLARIDLLLGHPRSDPHGDPIPDPDGTWPPPPASVRLSQAAPGSYVVLRVSDSDPARLTRLRQQGVVPGAVLTVSADRVFAGAAELNLAPSDGDAVRLRPPH